jgi:hypothetical protein
MSTSTTSIDRYSVFYNSSTSGPAINLWKNNVNNSIASLNFWSNGSVLPKDFTRPDGIVVLYYHLEDFANIIDLLRNEKPIFLFQDNIGYHIITSTFEPVGEGEK